MAVNLLFVLIFAGLSVCATGQTSDDIIAEANLGNKNNDPSYTETITDIFGRPPATPERIQQDYVQCTRDNVDGECVPFYLCSVNDQFNEYGEGVIDIRFKPDAPCQDSLTTCCFPSDKLAPQNRTSEPVKPVTPQISECGFRNVDGVGFKIKGAENREAEYGEFPWMAAILADSLVMGKMHNIYKCGGALIHPQIVLTGAHCIYNQDIRQLKVRLGEWDSQTENEKDPHIDVDVARIIVHEGFKNTSLINNFGLVVMAKPVPLGETISTICLPPQGFKFDGSRCVVTGWGKDNFNKDGKYQAILKSIDLPVVPHPQCQANLRKTRLGKHFKLHDSFMCAGGEAGKDACLGDGGSPLVCAVPHDSRRYYQAGIVSWGIGCGEAGVPGVYADVAKMRDWIDSQFKNFGVDTSSYNL